jgi:hypothetical protein
MPFAALTQMQRRAGWTPTRYAPESAFGRIAYDHFTESASTDVISSLRHVV